MFELKLYYGQVIDRDDPDEKGKIKVRVLPEMKDVETSKLPWLRPFFSDLNENAMTLNLPENDTYVWCGFTDDYFQEGWYITGVFLDGLFNYNDVKSDLSNITDIGSQSYPECSFKRYEDGTIIFHNSTTGETGIYHNTGSYSVIDSDGNMKQYSKKAIKLYNDNGEMSIAQDGTTTVKNGTSSIVIDGSTITIEGQSKNVTIHSLGQVTLSTVDSSLWCPNALPACLLSGAPHGGALSGIVNLHG